MAGAVCDMFCVTLGLGLVHLGWLCQFGNVFGHISTLNQFGTQYTGK